MQDCLLYEHLLNSVFEDVLCSSIFISDFPRNAYTFERGCVVNYTDTLGVVVLLLSSVGKDLKLGPASSPCWGESCLYSLRIRRAL